MKIQSLIKKMGHAEYNNSIYSDGDHLKFNESVRDAVKKVLAITQLRKSYSRPGTTQHNIKMCGVWPSAADCKLIYKEIKQWWPHYNVKLSFNGNPHTRGHVYNTFFSGLVVIIDVNETPINKQAEYVCPWSLFTKPEPNAKVVEPVVEEDINDVCIPDDEEKVLELYRSAKSDINSMTAVLELALETKFSKFITTDMLTEINKMKAPWSAVGINM